MIGVELRQFNIGAHDGKGYFQSKKGMGFGIFITTKQVKHIILNKSMMRKNSCSVTKLKNDQQKLVENNTNNEKPSKITANTKTGKKLPIIGDRVIFDYEWHTKQTGIVKFIGNVYFDDKMMVGVELDQISPNGNDGIIDGKYYFECDNGKGFFIPFHIDFEVIAAFATKNNSGNNYIQYIDKASAKHPKIISNDEKLTPGDRVIVKGGKIGVVKNVGLTLLTRCTDMVGIKLDKWSANAGNGIVSGFRYFNAPQGRGLFIHQSMIIKNFGPPVDAMGSKIQIGDTVKLAR